jgi:hypothetical protein
MTPNEVKAALWFAADPIALAHAMGLAPYPWQRRYIRTRSKRTILNVHRRGGKDEWEAFKSLERCVFDSRTCVVSLNANERGAIEWLRTVRSLYDRLPKFIRPTLVTDNATSLEFASGARVISLPCTESAPRGWGATRLFLNEAARIPDDVYLASRPTVAATGGAIVIASTPNGPQGFFHATWASDSQWERFLVPATDSPHITPEFLAEEKAALGSRWFSQEYECQFTASDDGIFAPELLDRAFAGGFPHLFAEPKGAA